MRSHWPRRVIFAQFGMVVGTHSSSGFVVGSRRVLRRVRHTQNRYWWLQPRTQEGDLRLKEPGDTNERDALTKLLGDRRVAQVHDLRH